MAVANATTAGPFEAFLKQFPNGVFAGIARAKIEEMNAPKQPPVATIPAPQRPEAVPQQSAEEQELAAWPSVAGATTPEPLEGFLRRFPTGMFADIAKAKIAEMKAPQQLAAVAVPRPPMRVPDVVPGPNRTAALLQDARAYDHEGRFDRAIQALDEAIRMDPKNAVGFNNRSVVYLHKGEAVRAIQDFDEAVRIDPNNATASRNRAFAYRSAGTLPPPSQSQVVQQEGDAFFKMGQFDRAIQYYDEAIRLDPKNAVAFISRSNAYRNLGRSDRADQDIDRAGRIQSD
jgi:tetratricopeptide (TPR) repeat protein